MSQVHRGARWLAVVLLVTATLHSNAAAEGVADESEKAAVAWLDAVEWIISPIEREVFLGLPPSDRAAFINAFWAARDPVASTSANEFKTEHERRLQHADEHLAEGSGKPGSKTDRGWAYILLGPPRSIQRQLGRTDVWPLEVWEYAGENRPGLPAVFYLTFYQPHGFGEWKLYDPGMDGPMKLTVRGTNRSLNDREAIDLLSKIDPELARAALAVDAAGPHDFYSGIPSSHASVELQRIRGISPRLAPDGYARRWAAGVGEVKSAESFTPYTVDLRTQLFRAEDGGLFLRVRAQVAPEHVVVEKLGERYVMAMELYTVLLDARGQELGDMTNRLEFAMGKEDLNRVQRAALCVGTDVAVAAPARKVRVLLRQPAKPAVGHSEQDLGDEVVDLAAAPTEVPCAWTARFDHEPLDHPAHRLRRAAQLDRAGQPGLAVPELRRALAAAPESSAVVLSLGRLLLQLKRARELDELMQPRVSKWLATVGPLSSGDVEALGLAATAKVILKELDRAAELYGRAVEAEPRSARLLNALAATEQARGRLDRAAELYARSLQAEPEQPRIRELVERLKKPS